MSAEAPDHERVSRLFLAACDRPPGEREAFVRREAGDDAALAREVLGMLAHDDPTDFDTPPPLAAPAPRDAAPELALPEEIGDYRVLGLLGVGGMGVVVRALQANPEREVALKLLRPGPDAGELAPRLEREARLLARLTHPGIARVYESGVAATPDGPRPFFAMELVEGRPITEHCDAERLDLRQRLALLARICDAVQHAHERGVVHRDLKPANVLVDGAGSPRVLDFGVAVACEGEAEARLTLDGSLIGTLAYMAPEQVRHGAAHADERGDVYALGALAYELLAHRVPLEVAGLSLAQAAQRIVEDEPAPLGVLDRRLAGDVGTIVAKALAKEPERRYRSAAALRDDLERWMRHEPVLARPASAVYRFSRFARRHRGLVTALGVLVVAALTVVAVSLRAAAVSARERARAERALGRAGAVRELLAGAIEGANPFAEEAQADATLVAMLDAFARRLALAPPADAAVDVETRLALARSYKGCSRYEAAAEQLAAAGARLAELDPGERELADGVRGETAIVRGRLGHWEEAAAGLRELTRELEARGAPPARRAPLLGDLVWALRASGELEEAERLGREALALARSVEPSDEELLASLATNLGAVLAKLGRREETDPLYREAYERYDRLYPWAHPVPATAANNLGWNEFQLDELEGAEAHLREAVGRFRAAFPGPHALRADYESNLALVLRARGDLEGAVEFLSAAIASYRNTIGEGHPEAVGALNGLGMLLQGLERWEEAADAFGRYARHVREGGAESKAEGAELDRARCLAHLPARRADAEEALFALLERAEGRGEAGASLTADVRAALAGLYEAWGRPDDAALWRD